MPDPHEPWLGQLRAQVESGAAAQFILTGNTDDLFQHAGKLVPLSRLLLETVLAPREVVFHISAAGEFTIIRGADMVMAEWTMFEQPTLLEGKAADFTQAIANYDQLLRQLAKGYAGKNPAILVELPSQAGDTALSLLAAWAGSEPFLERDYVSLVIGRSPVFLPGILRESRLPERVRVPYPGPAELGRDEFALGTTLRGAGSATEEAPEEPVPLVGHDEVREHLEQDFTLWQRGDTKALPAYYLLMGPRGTGKRTLLRTLAGVPLFVPEGLYELPLPGRPFDISDWLAQVAAQPRGIVLFPEAERLPGFGLRPTDERPAEAALTQHFLRDFTRRDRERRFLVFATTSRPDVLVPFSLMTGGDDYRLPLFPTSHTHGGFRLIRGILQHRFGLDLPEQDYGVVEENIPWLLTAAEALILARKTYRLVQLKGAPVAKAFNKIAKEHHSPLDNKVLEHQIKVAIEESSEPGFVPDLVRNHFVAQ